MALGFQTNLQGLSVRHFFCSRELADFLDADGHFKYWSSSRHVVVMYRTSTGQVAQPRLIYTCLLFRPTTIGVAITDNYSVMEVWDLDDGSQPYWKCKRCSHEVTVWQCHWTQRICIHPQVDAPNFLLVAAAVVPTSVAAVQVLRWLGGRRSRNENNRRSNV